MFPREQLEQIVKRVFIVKPFYFDAVFESERLYLAPARYTYPNSDITWTTVKIQLWNERTVIFRFRFVGAEGFETQLSAHYQRWLAQTFHDGTEFAQLTNLIEHCFPRTTIRFEETSQDILEFTIRQSSHHRRYQISKYVAIDMAHTFQTLVTLMIQDNFRTWHGNDWTLFNLWRERTPYAISWSDDGRYLPEITANDLIHEFQELRSLITGELPGSESRQKATDLLLNWLSEEQKQSYLENKTFIVIGGETGTKYRIRSESQINIDVLTGKLQGKRLCIVSQTYTPVEDQLLAQKLLIENNEDYFLEVADVW